MALLCLCVLSVRCSLISGLYRMSRYVKIHVFRGLTCIMKIWYDTYAPSRWNFCHSQIIRNLNKHYMMGDALLLILLQGLIPKGPPTKVSSLLANNLRCYKLCTTIKTLIN